MNGSMNLNGTGESLPKLIALIKNTSAETAKEPQIQIKGKAVHLESE